MLPKRNRLQKTAFDDVYKDGRHIHGTNIRAVYVFGGDKEPKFSVVIPKKVSASAVARNKLKRQIYDLLADVGPILPRELRCIFIVKNKVAIKGFENDLLKIAQMIGTE